jgi:hypothetical protein
VDEPRKSAIIAVCASILAARKLATVPRGSPAYVAAIADAVADARRIVERIEKESSGRQGWVCKKWQSRDRKIDHRLR